MSEEVFRLESFAQDDPKATQAARSEVVEPGGVRHSADNKIPLIDAGESLARVTNLDTILSKLQSIHGSMQSVVSQAAKGDASNLIPITQMEIVIGNQTNPASWIRVAPTNPDTENGNLRFFLNVSRSGMVDENTVPAGVQVEKGALVYSRENPGSPMQIHRRMGLQARRSFDESHVVGISLEEIQNENLSVWVVKR